MTWTYEHRWTLPAPPARVFEALTRAAELTRWFAEHADVGSEAGAPYRFWGRHTLGVPGKSDAMQVITRYERNRALSFRWRLGAADTEVAFTITPEGDASEFAVSHRVDGDLGGLRQKELIDDHWRLAMGNLMAHLAGGDGIMLPDYADPAPTVRLSLFIEAEPDTVFRTLTEPELINQWFFTTSAAVDLRAGGRYETNWRYQVDGRDVVGGPTKILEIIPGKKLVLDWLDWRGDSSVTGQTITFELKPEGKGTRLTFVHAGFTRTADIGDYPFGWVEFMNALKKVAEAAGLLTPRTA